MSKQIFSSFIGRNVIIRSEKSGVHFGVLSDIDDDVVRMKDTRRIWSCDGANTITEISNHGVLTSSRLSEIKDDMIVFGVNEIVPMTETAVDVMSKIGWGKSI